MMAVKIALGLLFVLNTAAFTLITASASTGCNPRTIIRFTLAVTAVNIVANALVFAAIY